VSAVLNPVEVEQAIREAANTVSEGVAVVSQRLQAYRDAQRKFDLAWARAYMSASGPVEERKQTSVLNTENEQEILDAAEVAYRFAERRAKAAESVLSAYQTISRSVNQMYSSAGTGEY
jgi:hypothetical protein